MNDQFDELVKNELISQIYFVIGLLFTKFANNLNSTIHDIDSAFKFSVEKLSTLVCFTKSSLISKPNGSFLNQDHFHSSKSALTNDFLKLLHRDSTWRYSVIANWLKFIIKKYFSNDQIEFIKQLKLFSDGDQVK